MRISILGSGSGGNCTLIESDNQKILIDAGFSGKETERRLAEIEVDPSEINALLVTHEHSDHIKGVRIIGNRWNIPVLANSNTAEVLKCRDQAPKLFTKFMTGHPFQLGDITVTPFPVPHDAAEPVGFIFEGCDKKIAMATDLGTPNAVVAHHMKNADLMILESNYNMASLHSSERPWRLKQRIMSRLGHLSNEDANALMKQTITDKTSTLIMAHISRDCNTHEIVKNVASKTLGQINRNDIQLHLAKQEHVTGPFILS